MLVHAKLRNEIAKERKGDLALFCVFELWWQINKAFPKINQEPKTTNY
jgi:hypothetical protein